MANKAVTNPCAGGGTKPEGVIIPLVGKTVAQCSFCGNAATVNKANGLFRKHNALFEKQPVVDVTPTSEDRGSVTADFAAVAE